MKAPIPNRIIRLVFRELLYLKFEERSEFQPIGIAFQNASRGCPFGREMLDSVFELIIKEGYIESNNQGTTLLKSQYRLTKKGKLLVRKGNYEQAFSDYITTRKFFLLTMENLGLAISMKKNYIIGNYSTTKLRWIQLPRIILN